MLTVPTATSSRPGLHARQDTGLGRFWHHATGRLEVVFQIATDLSGGGGGGGGGGKRRRHESAQLKSSRKGRGDRGGRNVDEGPKREGCGERVLAGGL